MRSLRDAAKELSALHVRVLGVSLDDVAALQSFADDEELPYRLLSDTDGSAATKYGVLGRGGRYAKRVTFVLDGEGVLRHVDRSVDVRTHGAALVEMIKKLKS